MEKGAQNRWRMVALLTILRDGDGSPKLLEFMSDADRDGIAPIIEEYRSKSADSVQMIMRQVVASEDFSSIAEVHPAWIIEKLKGESPRIVGIILRYLPSKHVRYILENIDPMLRVQIPSLIESFAVPTDLVESIRRRFEKNFEPMRLTSRAADLSFDKLYYLKCEELSDLFCDVGLTELAMAFTTMSSKALHTVFNRMDLKDAKRLQSRIKEMMIANPMLKRQARNNVIAFEGAHVGSRRFLFELGMAAFAHAIDKDDMLLVQLVQQRLAPVDAYLLKRFVDERRARFDADVAAERRNIFINALNPSKLNDSDKVESSGDDEITSSLKDKQPTNKSAGDETRILAG